MKIEKLKKELGLTNTDIAELFGLTPGAYANSSAKQRYEQALLKMYELFEEKQTCVMCDKEKAVHQLCSDCLNIVITQNNNHFE